MRWSARRIWAKHSFHLSLALILLVGGVLRFTYVGWDGFINAHPDERGLLFVAERFPGSPYRTPESDPNYYAYGTVPLALITGAERAWCLFTECPPLDRFTRLTIAARLISATADTLTILFTALIARRLHSNLAALIAGGLLAAAVLHIQQAHFGTVEALLAMWCTAALWATLSERRTAAGILAGLAVSTKLTGGLLILPLVVYYRDHLRQAALPLALMGGVFVLTNPYALADPHIFLTSIGTQQAFITGQLETPFSQQYLGTVPLVYPMVQQALWTLGLPLTVAGYIGLWRLKDESPALLAWTLAAMVLTGAALVKFPRYTLIYTPVLCIAAGMLLSQRRVLTALTVGLTAACALAFVAMYRAPHPWIAATDWSDAHLPAETVIAVEPGDAVPLDTQPYQTIVLDVWALPDDSGKLARLIDGLAAADTFTSADSRAYSTIAHLDTRYPCTAGLYRALFAGDLGYQPAAWFDRPPQLLNVPLLADPFRHLPSPIEREGVVIGPADDSFTSYDHPLVLVLVKEYELSNNSMLDRVIHHILPHNIEQCAKSP